MATSASETHTQAQLKKQREGKTRQEQAEMELLEELKTENYQLKAAVSNLSSENEQLKNMLKSSERER